MAQVVEFFGRDRGLTTQVEQQAASAGKLDDAYRDAAREARRLENDAKRAFESTRTPLEKYNRGLERQKELLASGKIDQETYNRRVNQLGQELRNAEPGFARLFGRGAINRITTFATSIGGAVLSLEAVRRVIAEINKEAEEAFSSAKGAEFDLASLAQVSESAAEFQRLVAQARRSQAEGVGEGDAGEAAQLIFRLQSAGALQERELFTQLQSTGVVRDASDLVTSIATLLKGFGPEEAGSFADLISKSFGAASVSSAVTAETLAKGAARASGVAGQLGLSDEEILAATAIISNVTGSAEQAGTQVRSLVRALALSGEFQGRTLGESVTDIAGRGLDAEGLQKLLKSEEATSGFQVLQKSQRDYEQALQATIQAEKDQLVFQRLQFPETDPSLRASRQARIEENRNAVLFEAEGATLEGARRIDRARQLRDIDNSFLRAITGLTISIEQALGLDLLPGGDVRGIQQQELLQEISTEMKGLRDDIRTDRDRQYRDRKARASTADETP